MASKVQGVTCAVNAFILVSAKASDSQREFCMGVAALAGSIGITAVRPRLFCHDASVCLLVLSSLPISCAIPSQVITYHPGRIAHCQIRCMQAVCIACGCLYQYRSSLFCDMEPPESLTVPQAGGAAVGIGAQLSDVGGR